MQRKPDAACQDWKRAKSLGVNVGGRYVKNQCK